MILEHRTYSFKPGTLASWLRKYETEGMPIQKRHLNRFLGAYVTEIGLLHQVVLLWSYDSLADREQRRQRLAADPEWSKYISEVWAMGAIEAQDVKIMNPVSFNPQ